jgi:hypothetical protein
MDNNDEPRELVLLRQNDPNATSVGIRLERFVLGGAQRALAEALQSNDHVTKITLYLLGMGYSANHHHWDTLLRVIAAKTNLDTVHLEDDRYETTPRERVIPFLRAIQENKSVRAVKFHWLAIAGNSLAAFLDSAQTVTKLNISCCDIGAPGGVHAVAAALQRRTNIERLTLGRFDETNLIPIVRSLAGNKNLHQLTFSFCDAWVRGQTQFHAAIFNLLQPHSSLRSLVLSDENLSQNGFRTAQDCAPLLTAVELSSLERFSLGTIVERQICLALIASIPKLRIRTLEFNLHRDLQDLKEDIMGAVQKNASLRTVVAKSHYSADWLDDDDRNKLMSYSKRNKDLAEWIENPIAVPMAVWPEALDVAQTFPNGRDAVFNICMALAYSLGQPVRE